MHLLVFVVAVLCAMMFVAIVEVAVAPPGQQLTKFRVWHRNVSELMCDADFCLFDCKNLFFRLLTPFYFGSFFF